MRGKLYLLELGGGLDGATWNEWSARASAERREALGRFRFRGDAERSLAGEILARAALSRATGRPPSAFSFARGENGKPRAVLPDRGWVPEFNISHSANLVACAVSPRPVGVDVERFFEPDEALIRRVCSAEEASFTRGGPLSKSAAITLIWTLKESCLKALGTGLIDHLPGLDLAPFLNSAEAPPWVFNFGGCDFHAFFHGAHAVAVCES